MKVPSFIKSDSDSMDLDELKAKADRSKIKISFLGDRIKSNRKKVNEIKIDYQVLKKERDEKNQKFKDFSSAFIGSHKKFKDMVEQRRKISNDFRDLKRKYISSKNPSEKDDIKEALFELKKKRTNISKQLSQEKHKNGKAIPDVAKLTKEVRELVQRAQSKHDDVKAIKNKNSELRKELKTALVEIKQLRKIATQ